MGPNVRGPLNTRSYGFPWRGSGRCSLRCQYRSIFGGAQTVPMKLVLYMACLIFWATVALILGGFQPRKSDGIVATGCFIHFF